MKLRFFRTFEADAETADIYAFRISEVAEEEEAPVAIEIGSMTSSQEREKGIRHRGKPQGGGELNAITDNARQKSVSIA